MEVECLSAAANIDFITGKPLSTFSINFYNNEKESHNFPFLFTYHLRVPSPVNAHSTHIPSADFNSNHAPTTSLPLSLLQRR